MRPLDEIIGLTVERVVTTPTSTDPSALTWPSIGLPHFGREAPMRPLDEITVATPKHGIAASTSTDLICAYVAEHVLELPRF
jgi:hypothetical protein